TNLQNLVAKFKLRDNVAASRMATVQTAKTANDAKPVPKPAAPVVRKPVAPVKPAVAAAAPKPNVTRNPDHAPVESVDAAKDGWGAGPSDRDISIDLSDKNFGKY
ncbi:MAG TPA: hypothetical protein DEB39_00060, partial [Planctomycetaceae bacterium]|nr:hypothetical protein [Planctomycetaceae bacterium]